MLMHLLNIRNLYNLKNAKNEYFNMFCDSNFYACDKYLLVLICCNVNYCRKKRQMLRKMQRYRESLKIKRYW